ncbi:MAG: hypothetical protein EXS05_15585 [Planctomycetaceae bacterium]|nr:hypothetical protein [Planctomycetaceae bacterium]
MDYVEYVRQISFRLLQPTTLRPAGFKALNRLARKAGLDLEMWMTVLPEDQDVMQRRLRPTLRVRRRSTFAIGAMINRGVENLGMGQVALCLGLGAGYPLFAAMAGHRDKVCIGVDSFHRRRRSRAEFLERFNRWRSPRHEFYEAGFREYLTCVHRGSIGLCTLGGTATFRERYEALSLIEPFLAENGVVLVEGTNTTDMRRAGDAFVAASPFEYGYLLDVQTPRSGHPTFGNGIQLLQRGKPKANVLPIPQVNRRAA